MFRFLASQLRHRSRRAAVLGAGILVSSVSFVLLAAAAKTSELRVTGTVKSNYRAAYDILVRPRDAKTPLERSQRLVRPNYLSGVFGGISFAQYEKIHRLPGVDVAAPIANIGFVLPFGQVGVSLDPALTEERTQIYRVQLSWLAANGASRYPGRRAYVYYTRSERRGQSHPSGMCRRIVETGPYQQYGPFARSDNLPSCYTQQPSIENERNWAQHHALLPPGSVGTYAAGYFPIFVAAVDPAAEARLVGLDAAVVSGRYLRASDRPHLAQVKPEAISRLAEVFPPKEITMRLIPAIISARPYADETLEVTIERLRLPPGGRVTQALDSRRAHSFLNRLEGQVVERRRLELKTMYENMLSGRSVLGSRFRNVLSFDNFWTTSPTRYRNLGGDLVEPVPTTNPITIWRNARYIDNGGFISPPPSNRDVQFRRLHEHIGSSAYGASGALRTPSFSIVGRFDPAKLSEFSPLSRVPLETYYPPLVEPADAAAQRALRGQPLLPTQNLGDYIQQPPLLLTTLAAVKSFFNPVLFSKTKPIAAKPISVIRVRVRGVTGPDELSLARIRAVATAIHRETGLEVDITAGSSPHSLLVELPAGKFGRPGLTVREGWSKKGVSVSFLRAQDKKSLALLSLVLVIGSFFLGNGAFATVRARRTEIGTLLCVGWSQSLIFAAILGETALVGLAAGTLGVGLATVIVTAFGLQFSVASTLLVLPVALGLALVAGLIPAWRAARSVPLDSVRPVIAGEASGLPVHRIASMALTNLRRLPARTLVAVVGLFVGVAALTVIYGINRAFQGTLVGTLLGNAISLRIRPLDFAAVGITITLAALALADVLFLNLRERAVELVTLRTLGWGEQHLRALIALEALAIGVLGSITGGVAGVAVGAAIDVPLVPLSLAALGAAIGGIAVALIASLLPLSRLQHLTPPAVLAEE